jgi:chromosome segregation ATPase
MSRTTGSSEVESLRRLLKDSEAQEKAAHARLEQLQDEVATLKADLNSYTDKVMQVEIAHESERLARESLTRRLERLLKSIDSN